MAEDVQLKEADAGGTAGDGEGPARDGSWAPGEASQCPVLRQALLKTCEGWSPLLSAAGKRRQRNDQHPLPPHPRRPEPLRLAEAGSRARVS